MGLFADLESLAGRNAGCLRGSHPTRREADNGGSGGDCDCSQVEWTRTCGILQFNFRILLETRRIVILRSIVRR